jgi:hypothetical protein
MSKALKEIQEFRHQKLRDLLNQCTDKQKKFFNRMYGSVDTIPDEKIDWAIQQCENTIKKNSKKEPANASR